MNTLSQEFLNEINSNSVFTRHQLLYHDSSLNFLFKGISANMQFMEKPYISSDDIYQVIQAHGTDIQFITEQEEKPKVFDYQKLIGNQKKPSEYNRSKFRGFFNKALRNPLLQKENFTHCFIFLFENQHFYLMLIVLQAKFVIVDQIQQRTNGIFIYGWSYHRKQISGAQFIDGDQYYEIDEKHFKIQQVVLPLQTATAFEIFVENSCTTILPLLSNSFLDPPVVQIFTDNLIFQCELREQKSQLNLTDPLYKLMQAFKGKENQVPIKSTLASKAEQIIHQKHSGFFQEFQPKVPKPSNLQLFKIEENQYEQSSAKHNTKDLDEYTKNLEQKYLTSQKHDKFIDGLINKESQLIDHSNSLLPLTHKEQSLSEIHKYSGVPTTDSAIKEHLNNLETKQYLQQIIQELNQEHERQVQANTTPYYNVESQYFTNQTSQGTYLHESQQPYDCYRQPIGQNQQINSQIVSPYQNQQQQYLNSLYNQTNPNGLTNNSQQQYIQIQNSYQLPSNYLNHNNLPQQPLQQQYYLTQEEVYQQQEQQQEMLRQQFLNQQQVELQAQQQYYLYQLSLFQQIQQQQQQLYLQQQTQAEQEQQNNLLEYQQFQNQRQQQTSYEPQHQQQVYEQGSSIVDDASYECFKNSPKKWSYSPPKAQDKLSKKRRTSNPEQQHKQTHRYSIRESIAQSMKREQLCIQNGKHDFAEQLKKLGGQVRQNEVAFACKLKINSLHPADFNDLSSNRAQRKIAEIEQNLAKHSLQFSKQSIQCYKTYYNNQKFADAILYLQGQEYKVHRNVLAANSSYFRKVFEKDSRHSLENLDIQAFETVLKYIYHGSLCANDWEKIRIGDAHLYFRAAEQFNIIQFLEQLTARVIIPKMDIRNTLHWFLRSCRNKEACLQHIFKLIYQYSITQFCTHSKEIISLVRNQKQLAHKNQELYKILNEEFQQMKSEEVYYLIQQPLMQTDQQGIDHILWLFSLKKKSNNVDLLKTLSKDYKSISGFKYKDFSAAPFELYLNSLGPQILVLQTKLDGEKQEPRRKSAVYTDDEFTYSERVLEEYSFVQQQLNFTNFSINKLAYELKLTCLNRNQTIISECFASQSTAWRCILEINSSNSLTIYLQERGQIKNNLKYMNLGEDYLDEFLPHFTKLSFISLLIKVEIVSESKAIQSRQIYHSFPTNQFHSIGISDLCLVQDSIHIRVYLQEDPLHSALMTWCACNFSVSYDDLPFYTLYSLLKSDMLNVEEEKSLCDLLKSVKNQEDNLDLIIHPIRYFYIPLTALFDLAKQCEHLRKNRLFQSVLNLVLALNLEERAHHQRPRKLYTKQEKQISRAKFRQEWIRWLLSTEPGQPMRVNVEECKKEVLSSQEEKKKILSKEVQTSRESPSQCLIF